MKILGIDDNEDLLSLCEITLSSEGHEYTGINNGREGLQAIKDEKFDVVLLDLSMPDFSGVDVIDALVKDGLMNKQKIVIFTASSTSDIQSELFMEKGVHSVITKPLDVDTLLEHVHKIASE
jgi:DNA-binding response OmpR family regulator